MSRWRVEGLETDLERFHLGPVDLDLDPGHAIVVLGTSGAGKTTLLRAIAGFLPTRRGRVLRDGEDLSRVPPEGRGLGYVPQGLGLLAHRTVAQNVRYPMELRDRRDAAGRTRALLERFHLVALAERRPAQLSGGEQQRVAIARALAAEPDLILWDEPWQALDVIARHELNTVWEELRAADEVPIVVVTHDPALAFSIADSFLLLDRGRVLRRASARELLEAPTDEFVARFIGLENVYDRGLLDRSPAGSLGAWLRERAGPAGIAFGTPAWSPTGGSTGLWEGKVLQARPDAQGIALEVRSGALVVHFRVPAPVAALPPGLGRTVRFGLDGVGLQRLGDGPGPGGAVDG